MSAQPEAGGAPHQASRGLKVLVIDDDPAALETIGHLLEHLGHTVALCDHAEQALQRLQTESFSLLMIDYRMPELTGIDVVTILRTESCHLPVIMMSGYSATGERVSPDELGIVAMLKKPIQVDQLSHAIEECLLRAESAAGRAL